MKHFIVALITGVLYAVLGTGSFILIVTSTIHTDLSCRDCQGAAGMIVVILLGVVAGLFVFGSFIGAVASFYFRDHHRPNNKIIITLSAILFIVIALVYSYFGFINWSINKDQENMMANQAERNEYEAGMNVTGAEGFSVLTSAISENDTLKVEDLIHNAEPSAHVLLQYALDLNFNYQHKISFSIFKILFEHTADPAWTEYPFDPVMLCTRECNPKLLSLLLTAKAPLLSESGFYPTCAENLSLLLKSGLDVNTKILATEYPYSTSTMPQSIRDNPNLVGNTKWTMIMKYANNYPEYVDATKLLITQGADLTYKDENGESLQTIIDEWIKIYTSPTEPMPKDLLELKAKLNK
jgi:hypothetical protein